jgi:hypothetical protein
VRACVRARCRRRASGASCGGAEVGAAPMTDTTLHDPMVAESLGECGQPRQRPVDHISSNPSLMAVNEWCGSRVCCGRSGGRRPRGTQCFPPTVLACFVAIGRFAMLACTFLTILILPPFNQFSCIVASSRGANVPGLRGLRAVAGVKREILQRQRRLVPRPRRPLAQQRDQRPRGDYMYASLGGRPIVNFSDFQSETSENQFLRSMTSSPRTKIISQLKSIRSIGR